MSYLKLFRIFCPIDALSLSNTIEPLYMEKIRNLDLFRGRFRNDQLFITAREPVHSTNELMLDIYLEDEAVVLDSVHDEYPLQPTVNSIREYNSLHWLLSGGVLLRNEKYQLALGLRDCNAADPMTFTNIAAGRCNRKLYDHCLEELYSEVVLCVKDVRGDWIQLSLGPQAIRINDLDLPIVANKLNEIKYKLSSSGHPINCESYSDTGHCLFKHVVVNWKDKQAQIVHMESLSGYVVVDENHHTIEFRLPLQIDLSCYQDNVIFFAEGTGYAEWMTPAQIYKLHLSELIAERHFLTPFLRNYILVIYR